MREQAELHDTDVDGVRCFWVASGRPTLTARLMFRYGLADEPLEESGWQHLVEHLALDDNGGHGGLDINGSVSLHETSFDAHGDPAAVAEHLAAVTGWLREPALARLAHERHVLQAEADARGRGPVANALSWRYGAQGPGLAAMPELGLGRADEAAVRDRIQRVFTRENAVLALDGPPPVGLSLDLAPGALRPLPEARPVEVAPAAYVDEAGLALSGVVRRGGGMFVGVLVLERALREALRHEAAGAYAPWSVYERVDHENAVVVVGSDVQARLHDSVVQTALGILDAYAVDGPPPDWLGETIERVIRSMTDPYAVIGVAFGAAHRHLHGFAPESLDDALARVSAVTVEQLRDDLEDLRETLLLGAPAEAVSGSPLPVLSFPLLPTRPDGQSFRSINWPADRDRLRIQRDRIEVSDGDSARVVRFDDLAGYLTFEDGVRHLLRSDGYGITIDPAWWTRGSSAVAAVDARVPTDLHLPQPAPPERPPVERWSFLRRWWHGVREALTSPWNASVALILLLTPILTVVGMNVRDRSFVEALVIAGVVSASIAIVSNYRLLRREA
jgi:zinc protease